MNLLNFVDIEEDYNSNKNRVFKLEHCDDIYLSIDHLDNTDDLSVGDYFTINEYGKLESYEDQVVNGGLFLLKKIQYKKNPEHKWYKFWIKKQIPSGCVFTFIKK